MKKLLCVVLTIALLLSVAACGKPVDETGEMNVYVLSGPTGIGALNLWEKAELGEAKNTYNFTLTGANEEIVSAISKGEADIAAVATNLASTLYNRTEGGVTVLAVNTAGVLYMLSNGEEINSIADLKGRDIYAFGQGANPEYILRYVLSGNGVNADTDVKINFVAEGADLLNVWANDSDAIIMAPQPVATNLKIKNAEAKTLFDMSEEWDKISSDSKLYMGCVIVRNEYLKENKGAVDTFLKEYKESIEKAISDVEGTAALCEKRGIIPKAAIAKQAIPYCGLTFVEGKELKEGLSGYLKVMYDANAKSVGGKLPEDNFYYAAD